MKLSKPAFILALVGAVTLASPFSPANAVLSGQASNTSSQSVSSGIFSLVAKTTAGGTATTGSLTDASATKVRNFYVNNFGSINTSKFKLTFTGTTTATYQACPVGATLVTTTCSSGSLTTFTLTSNVATFAIPSGSWVAIRMTTASATVTISISISSAQLRTAVVSNS
jgi:hypothetical protein